MKNLKFKIISIGIGVFISLFFAEIFSRVYFFGTAAFSYTRTNSFGILDNSGLIKYSDSKDLLYELIPNLDTKYKLTNFKTNTEGFRDRNHTIQSNTNKIAFLGDSFTMGTGVSETDMFALKTEQILNKQDHKVKYESLNFGVSGYALNNYNTILKRDAIKYNPDLVVIGFCASNDHFRIGTDFSLDGFKIKPKKNVFWDSYLKKFLIIKLYSTQPKPVVYKKEHVDYIDKQFQTFQNTFNKNNSKGLVLYLDLIYDPIRVKHIKALAEKNNLLFIDTSEFFKDKNLFKYIVNELDPHPNGKANQIFADKLSSYILANRNDIFNNGK